MAVVVVLLFALYRRAMSDLSGLYALYVIVLLDDEVAYAQRRNLLDFVRATPASNAHELDMKVHNAVTGTAGAYAGTGANLLATGGFLWKAKEGMANAP
ncbi:MAG: hypothetical protein P4M09_12425 [Devosia sp.]|nr:hypothetical protein [Devosia sp.]